MATTNPCIPYIQTIKDDECLYESLEKINNNFQALENITCDLETKIDALKTTRLFFYYGVNAQTNLQDGAVSRPSNSTIYNFLNDTNQLNLPSISYFGDIAYVLYQKTGFLNNQSQNISTDFRFANTTSDITNSFVPVFVIWKFKFDGTNYIKENGFPKFTRNIANGSNWNNPQAWTTFNSWT